MATEYRLSYTATEIDEKLGKVDKIPSIEEDVSTIYDDLYDTKISYGDEIKECSTVSFNIDNMNVQSGGTIYNDSTFDGWITYLGNPATIGMIKFAVCARNADNPISNIKLTIYEFPDEIPTVNTTTGIIYSPSPNEWTVLYNKEITLEQPIINYSEFTIIKHYLETPITNNTKHLMIRLETDLLSNWNLFSLTRPDIPFNCCDWYTTLNSSIVSSRANSSFDIANTTVWALPVEVYSTEEPINYPSIGTESGDRFSFKVNEVLSNNGILDKKVEYLSSGIGSQDLFDAPTAVMVDQTSTFTGVCFGIGHIPSSTKIDGFRLALSARTSDDGTITKSASKCYFYMYTVEDIPYTTSSTFQFDTLNPTLVRSQVESINIPVGTQEVVDIIFNEPFYNIDNKFLMIGYNLDTYNHRCVNKYGYTGAATCSANDDYTYETNLTTFYSTDTGAIRGWSPGWLDITSNAYTIISTKESFGVGEYLENIIKESVIDISGIDPSKLIVPTSEVRLAAQYDLVVGDTFQLFYDGVIKSFMPAMMQGVVVKCQKGNQYPRYYEFTPTASDVGSYTLDLYTRNLDGSIISYGQTTLVVHEALTNNTTPENLKMLIFGDSLTAAGIWETEGLRRIYGSATSGILPNALGITNTITTYGSKTNTVNGFTVNHEGGGGAQWGSYLSSGSGASTTNGIIVVLPSPHNYDLNTVQKSIWTDNNGKLWELEDFPADNMINFNRGNGNNAAQSSTTLPSTLTCAPLSLTIIPENVMWQSTNPFYDELSDTISFSIHAAEYGIDSPDIVAICMTWNGGVGGIDLDHSARIDKQLTGAREVINTIHAEFPNAKVICVGTPLCSLTGGTGYHYGANGDYADMWATATFCLDYNKALEEMLLTGDYSDYCYYVDTKGQFDSYNNMPYTEKPVNTRSSVTERFGNNGVHPSTEGYYQMGDAFYRALTKVIPTLI